MNRFVLTAEERAVFDRVAHEMGDLSTASQYNILRNLAHAMDREVVRIGAIRAAAAVAGSTARMVAESRHVKQSPAMQKKAKGAPKGYPKSFVEGPGRQLLAKQATCKAAMSDPPSEAQRAALRAASEAVRDCFRRFNAVEAEETQE